jgi:alpha-tubulin suppressor-like RCC1 family protein
LYCWGKNASGQLGDGTTMDRTMPVAVSGGLVISGQSEGVDHTCARTTTQVTYCWGANSAGQLGNGGAASSNVPIKIVGQL